MNFKKAAIIAAITAVLANLPAYNAFAAKTDAQLSHTSGTYDGSQLVSVVCLDKDSEIYYTTDGTMPDEGSEQYTGMPVLITSNTVIRIAEYSDGELVSSDKASIRIRTMSPSASVDGGEYSQTLKVKLTCPDSDAVIYYTTDGTTPNKASKKYTKAITTKKNTTLKFIAYSSDRAASKVITEKYTISDDEFDNALCQKLFELVNETRAEYGLSPLKTLDTLTQAAEIRAREYSSNLSHWRPNGTKWHTILDEYGLMRDTRAENLAYYYSTAKSVLNCWMDDPWHSANILNPDAEYIGIGCYTVSGCNYWCQLFIGGDD